MTQLKTIKSFLIASASFLALSPSLSFAQVSSSNPALPSSSAQPLSRIVQNLESVGFNPIVDIDYENGRWQIEAYRHGVKYDIRVDPNSGHVLSEQMDD